jgi:DNA-binding CsgD family transcriptional regulator
MPRTPTVASAIEPGLDPADLRLADHLAQLARLPSLYRRLRSAGDVAELFARAAALTREECDVTRALVLTIDGHTLTARASGALADVESDRLRRTVLAEPIQVEPNTLEYDLVHGRRPRAAAQATRPCVLASVLALENVAMGAVAPDGQPLALLVADRPGRPLDDLDRATIGGLAALIGMALEHVVTKSRLAEVATELNHLTQSAQALMQEVLHAPLSIPTDRGAGYAFARQSVGRRSVDLRDQLTEREEQIASLLVEGRSNAEIADRLMLSPETVKTYVARLRKKLNAVNRVEAASIYLKMVQRAERDLASDQGAR